ncbi:MAG: DUF1858 domain-containing protein [bacterium]|nr:DUF1858 domain-containing protein [bacterium]
MSNDPLIEPSTKVSSFLERYPQLEDELITFAPPFRKLRNPLLRHSIGRVATLAQAASVARVPATELVDYLRALVGQPPLAPGTVDDEDYFPEPPAWFEACEVVAVVDEREEDPEQTEMAIVRVLRLVRELSDRQLLELVTTFLPAPGIGVMRRKGYGTWCRQDPNGVVHTYLRGK